MLKHNTSFSQSYVESHTISFQLILYANEIIQ